MPDYAETDSPLDCIIGASHIATMNVTVLKSALAALIIVATPGTTATAHPGAATEIADAAARERGDLSQLLVLGTSHLSSLPKDFDRTRFDVLVERLEAWRPEAIAIEALGGAQCDFLREYAFAYPGTADDYCVDPAPARASLGMTGAQAAEEIEATLFEAASDRAPEQRRRLATLFLAVGEPDSALVQWLRLPAAERKAEGALDQSLVEYLDKRINRSNENSIIAAPLAARLGHERLYPVDDHTGDAATGPFDNETYGAEMSSIWDNAATRQRLADTKDWDARLAAGASIVDWYSALNSSEAQRLTVESDFGAAAGSQLPGNSGRKYLAYWETRNLRMVGNLRMVLGDGRRVLAIVGASHKPYYERYLAMTSDVELADVDAVLAEQGDRK